MITFLLVIFAIAVAMTMLGEIFGKEPVMGSSFFSYPIKIEFERKWLQVVYRICWAIIIIALSADVTLFLYSQGVLVGLGWLYLVPSLIVAALLFMPLSMVAAIILVLIILMLCFLFDKENWENI